MSEQMDDEHDAPDSPPSLSRGDSVTHPDGETGHVIDDTLSLLVSSGETEGEKDLPPFTTFEELPLRRELPGRIFHDFTTGQVHVYVAPHMYPEPKLDPAPGIPVSCPSVPRQRWRPNSQQLTLLERHFNAGFSKASPELFAAVRSAGEATETQVCVWLKNRLARTKRSASSGQATSTATMLTQVPSSAEITMLSTEAAMHGLTANYHLFAPKRVKRQADQPPRQVVDDVRRIMKMALAEVSNALLQTSSTDVRFLTSELIRRQKICCYGIGRERCALQAFVIRLKQLGLDAHLIGETSMPIIGPRDLLLASAGPSFFNTVNAICLAGIRAKAHVLVLTSHRTAPVPFAESVIRIPAPPVPASATQPVKLHPQQQSGDPLLSMDRFLPLGSAYESALWMLFETVCLLVQHELGISEADMLLKSTNLE